MGILKNYCYFLGVSSLCVSLILLNPLSSYANSESESESYLFVFGDSLYDPGNNVIFNPSFRASRCPNGMTYFHKATGRLSDGRLVPDFIASKMNLPFIPPIMDEDADFTHGASFASSGSGVFDNHPNAINLPQQYINFTNVAKNWSEELGEEEAKRRLMKAVYLSSLGGNDYFSYGNNNRDASITELQSVVDRAIADMEKVIKDMYDLGARKFMFQNVGPLGCLPMIQQRFGISEGCARPPLTLAVLHNIALFKMAESIKLSSGYSQFTYSIFDYYTLLGERIRAPNENGFTIGDAACFQQNAEWAPLPYGYNCTDSTGTNQLFNGAVCSNPDSYVFFDTGHNTDGLNKALSEILWNGGKDFVFPYNMKQLVELDLTTSLNIDTKNKPLSQA